MVALQNKGFNTSGYFRDLKIMAFPSGYYMTQNLKIEF